jgi:hypothetical protein
MGSKSGAMNRCDHLLPYFFLGDMAEFEVEFARVGWTVLGMSVRDGDDIVWCRVEGWAVGEVGEGVVGEREGVRPKSRDLTREARRTAFALMDFKGDLMGSRSAIDFDLMSGVPEGYADIVEERLRVITVLDEDMETELILKGALAFVDTGLGSLPGEYSVDSLSVETGGDGKLPRPQ